jgi:hypothetical protein
LHEAAYKGHESTYNILLHNSTTDTKVKDIMGMRAADYWNITEKRECVNVDAKVESKMESPSLKTLANNRK